MQYGWGELEAVYIYPTDLTNKTSYPYPTNKRCYPLVGLDTFSRISWILCSTLAPSEVRAFFPLLKVPRLVSKIA